jgi:hypothetical protein
VKQAFGKQARESSCKPPHVLSSLEKEHVIIHRLHGTQGAVIMRPDPVAETPSKGRKKRTYGNNGLLFCVCWKRVVLDEAQIIKNHRTKVAQATWLLASTHRYGLLVRQNY